MENNIDHWYEEDDDWLDRLISLQGVAMKRPSRIYISIDSLDDRITRVRVGGQSVLVAEGTLRVSLADKLHNARAILADLRAGHDVFARFNAPRQDQAWYYDALAAATQSYRVLARAFDDAGIVRGNGFSSA